jgi:SAM-dependent methyltransferase
MKNNNVTVDQLIELGIIKPPQVSLFHKGVRDNPELSVMRCEASGLMFLSNSSHIDKSYYAVKEGTSYWGDKGRDELLQDTYQDDYRRFCQFKSLIAGKRYLDVGTGLGGILDLVKGTASSVAGIEVQDEIRKELTSIGYQMYSSTDDLPSKCSFDVISLFHVFEHLSNPMKVLSDLYNHLSVGGKIIIEVPHAKDALISIFDLDSFKKFTFWSEHLILHTRQSLNSFLSAAGFENISVNGFQRYPLANHLLWLWKGQPGGHSKLNQFRNDELDNEYSKLLNSLDATDTLIAIAEKC